MRSEGKKVKASQGPKILIFYAVCQQHCFLSSAARAGEDQPAPAAALLRQGRTTKKSLGDASAKARMKGAKLMYTEYGYSVDGVEFATIDEADEA